MDPRELRTKSKDLKHVPEEQIHDASSVFAQDMQTQAEV